ncbi:hypothetical protein Goklo_026817, partial [Gossypium klotzschianum]|nr:hypothetical protein [Gossypium klotzschianum]
MEGKKITRQLTHITWNPSLGATMKINFDATFNGNNARSALEVVVRNVSGEVVALKEINHRGLGFDSVTVEGDSLTTIKKSKCSRADKSVISVIIRDIQERGSLLLRRCPRIRQENIGSKETKGTRLMVLASMTLFREKNGLEQGRFFFGNLSL